MWMLFLSSFINFCWASNLLWSFLCFSIYLHFGRLHGSGSQFEKNQPLKAQLHMAYDIPTRFHTVWSRHLLEIERITMCGRIIIVKKKRRIAIRHRLVSGWLIIKHIQILIKSWYLLAYNKQFTNDSWRSMCYACDNFVATKSKFCTTS